MNTTPLVRITVYDPENDQPMVHIMPTGASFGSKSPVGKALLIEGKKSITLPAGEKIQVKYEGTLGVLYSIYDKLDDELNRALEACGYQPIMSDMRLINPLDAAINDVANAIHDYSMNNFK